MNSLNEIKFGFLALVVRLLFGFIIITKAFVHSIVYLGLVYFLD